MGIRVKLRDCGIFPQIRTDAIASAAPIIAIAGHFCQVDLSSEMLEVSRQVNPDCEHLLGDMRTLRLHRAFEAVFIHDAIDYMTTLDDLRQVAETAFLHCESGGMALFVPDHVRETSAPSTDHGGNDGEGALFAIWNGVMILMRVTPHMIPIMS